MKQIIAIPLSIVFYISFLLVLLVFHPIQWVCITFFGYGAHKKSVDYLNFSIVSCLRILGTTFKVEMESEIPKDTPIIFVSNHQSMYDIPPMIWYLRHYHPKFVSKKELGKGIPSISFNLNHGGSVLIDRKNPIEAQRKLKEFGKYIEENRRSAVIYPEGTRSKDGILKEFKQKGLQAMMEEAPNALIVPVTLNNTYKITRKSFPLGIGAKVSIFVHPVYTVSKDSEDFFPKLREVILSKHSN